MVMVKAPVLPFIVPETCIGLLPWWFAKLTVPVNVLPVCVTCHVMFPIEPPGIPIPIEPVDIPIVVPLESNAVPTHVPATAAEVPVPVGLVGAVAIAVWPAGIDVFPPHEAKPTAKAKTIETCHMRIGSSMLS
jgi:hypothetical protein